VWVYSTALVSTVFYISPDQPQATFWLSWISLIQVCPQHIARTLEEQRDCEVECLWRQGSCSHKSRSVRTHSSYASTHSRLVVYEHVQGAYPTRRLADKSRFPCSTGSWARTSTPEDISLVSKSMSCASSGVKRSSASKTTITASLRQGLIHSHPPFHAHLDRWRD
jgi:hypothetical protein